MEQPEPTPDPTQPGLGEKAAAILVFGSSAAVLVVELVALRLLAPYLGLTLETSTIVIGLALSAIAAGSWAGGQAADRVDPRRTLGPLLAISGVVVASTPFLVRGAGEADPSGGLVLLVSALTIVVPGALLSAITPMVTKLALRTLDETGTVVGRLSGIGTVGAITGTVLTGFVLISTVRVSVVLVGLGVLLVAGAALTEARVRGWRFAVLPSAFVVLAGGAAALAPGGCDVETTYHCASVVADEDRPGGRTLVLDDLRHSYVDLDDPTHLEFAYVRAYAATIDAVLPGDDAIDAHHVGGGGLTLPRWLRATRPGTTSTVSEIDPGVVEVDRDRLGLRTGDDLRVRVEDGRIGLRRLEADSRDLVVGDAFGGVSVPWHLTTREALQGIDRALRPGGLYVANLIDYPPLGFVRAQVATIAERWEHVVVLATSATIAQDRLGGGGNVVVAASHRPVDVDAIEAGLAERGVPWEVVTGPVEEGPDGTRRIDPDSALGRFVGDARVLTDDFAPVDQLLSASPFRA